MKKFLIITFALFMANLPSFATITPEEVTSQSYTENHGYSSETARLIELQHSQINNIPSNYVQPKEAWQNIKFPKWCTEKRIAKTRKVFEYLDCGLDDGHFGANKPTPTTSPADL